jgi:iron complex transport system substrate-binding protein
MRLVVVASLACLACIACESGGEAPARELRVVSLTPSATEVVAALGATPALVGVDDYSKFPAEVTKLPKVGSFLQPNLEAIVRLHPTLVIVDDIHATTARGLADAGITAVECPMHALPDVRAALHTLGDRLGKAREASAAVAALDAAIEAARAGRPAHAPRVLLVIDREAGGLAGLVAAGPGSWLDELLAIVGGNNVLTDAGTRYPKLGIEQILRAKPEVIVDVSYATKQGSEAWQTVDVPAVAAHKVLAFDPEAYPYLAGPSPRVQPALEALARAVH